MTGTKLLGSECASVWPDVRDRIANQTERESNDVERKGFVSPVHLCRSPTNVHAQTVWITPRPLQALARAKSYTLVCVFVAGYDKEPLP